MATLEHTVRTATVTESFCRWLFCRLVPATCLAQEHFRSFRVRRQPVNSITAALFGAVMSSRSRHHLTIGNKNRLRRYHKLLSLAVGMDDLVQY